MVFPKQKELSPHSLSEEYQAILSQLAKIGIVPPEKTSFSYSINKQTNYNQNSLLITPTRTKTNPKTITQKKSTKAATYNLNNFPIHQYIAKKTKINKKFIHKHKSINIVIGKPITLKSEKIFRTQLIIPFNNPFFFDHEYQHVPGILLVEAFRQLVTAVGHIFFKAPMNHQYIVHDINTIFHNYTNLKDATYLDIEITNIEIKRNNPRKMAGKSYIHQNGKIVSEIKSSWTILPKELVDRLEPK